LRFVNAKYLLELMSVEEVADRVEPLLKAAGYGWEDEDYLLDVLDILRPRAETLQEIVDQASYFFLPDDAYVIDEEARKKIAAGQQALEDLERSFSMLDWFDEDAVDDLLDDYVRSREIKKPAVLMPLRAALTGTTNAPSVTDLVVILGRERVLRRIGRALAEMTAALPDDKPTPEEAKAAEEAAQKAEEARRAAAAEAGRAAQAAARAAKAIEDESSTEA